MSDLLSLFKQLSETNVTKTIRREPYPAISPSRPELNQAGRVVLVTGGGTGVGYTIARSFVRASAGTLIIIGRRADVLTAAGLKLEQEAKTSGTNTKVLTFPCDLLDLAQVEAFWKDLQVQGITVDVLISNAGIGTEPKSILELGADKVWSQFEINTKAPLYFAEKFSSQSTGKQKFLVNVSTSSIHLTAHPGVAIRPSYTLTKMAGTHLFQLIAQHVPSEKMQIVSYHPGSIWSEGWKSMGLPQELFDDDDLSGAVAVWATTKEAEFLHGRFIWASWDVEELAKGEIRKRIDEDPYFLRTSIVGLNGGLLA